MTCYTEFKWVCLDCKDAHFDANCDFFYAVMWTVISQDPPFEESIQWKLASEGTISV